MSGGVSDSFGYGQSKSKSVSASTQHQESVSGDTSMATSGSTSSGSSQTRQSLAFEDLYKRLYGGASDAASQTLLNAGDLTGAARQLFSGGSSLLESLGQDAGSQYLEGQLTDEGGMVEEQIGHLREDAGRLFSEQLNPAITSRAVAGGTLGGGRQGVAQGIAQEGVAREFSRGATAIRLADQGRKDTIAAQIASNTLASSQTGLAALPGLLDTFERGQNAQLGVYSSLASIMGGPTVLSQSDSRNQAEAAAQSLSEAFSRAFSDSRSDAWSRTNAYNTDRSHSSNASFGGGGGGGGGGAAALMG